MRLLRTIQISFVVAVVFVLTITISVDYNWLENTKPTGLVRSYPRLDEQTTNSSSARVTSDKAQLDDQTSETTNSASVASDKAQLDDQTSETTNSASVASDKAQLDDQTPFNPSSNVTKTVTTYKILYYTHYFGGQLWPQYVDLNIKKCGDERQYKCIGTNNRNDIHNSDAVVFLAQGNDLDSCVTEGTKHRLQSQRWILCNQESPVHSSGYHKFKGIFNWTATYRLNSDVWLPYGCAKPGQHKSGFDQKMNYLDGRNKSIIAVISNCFSPRLSMVKALKKYIDIDIFGSCGQKSLCRHSDSCWSVLKEYKFYLSFENSICKDYITEKTYLNGYDHGIVPLILSGANLSNPNVVPQGSYIDASKFASAKELADHLIQVGSNPNLYNKLFEWRARWTTTLADTDSLLCRVCKKLHESNDGSFKTYEDMSKLHSSIDCKPYPTWK